MENYFLKSGTGRERREAFFDTKASLDFGNAGMTYRQLALINAEGIMVSLPPGTPEKAYLLTVFARTEHPPSPNPAAKIRRISSTSNQTRLLVNGATALTASAAAAFPTMSIRALYRQLCVPSALCLLQAFFQNTQSGNGLQRRTRRFGRIARWASSKSQSLRARQETSSKDIPTQRVSASLPTPRKLTPTSSSTASRWMATTTKP